MESRITNRECKRGNHWNSHYIKMTFEISVTEDEFYYLQEHFDSDYFEGTEEEWENQEGDRKYIYNKLLEAIRNNLDEETLY